jgi:hypothetical protein
MAAGYSQQARYNSLRGFICPSFLGIISSGIPTVHLILRFFERFTFPIALLAGAIGLVYWYWTTTPSYTINCVVESVRHHDSQTFDKYVDIESIASRGFDDFIDGPARRQVLGQLDSMVGVGFLRFFKHSIISVAHERVLAFVGDRSIDIEHPIPATSESLRQYKITPKVRQTIVDYGLTRGGFKGVKYLKINRQNALVGLEFYSRRLKSRYIVEFKLEDVGGYWRVTELTNLRDLIDRYMQSQPELGNDYSWQQPLAAARLP